MRLLGFSHLGGQIQKRKQFGDVNRRFLANLVKSKKHACYQNYCVDFKQILHSDKDYRMPFMGSPNTLITNTRLRTAAILKNRKIAIFQQQLNRPMRNLAQWRILALLTLPAPGNFHLLKIQDGGGRHLETSINRDMSASF